MPEAARIDSDRPSRLVLIIVLVPGFVVVHLLVFSTTPFDSPVIIIHFVRVLVTVLFVEFPVPLLKLHFHVLYTALPLSHDNQYDCVSQDDQICPAIRRKQVLILDGLKCKKFKVSGTFQ